MLVLDSTVLIDHLRGRPVVQRLTTRQQQGEFLATTALNVEEVVRGLRAHEFTRADELVSNLIVLPVTRAVADRSGTWRREFGASGITLHQADCLVAACAFEAGATLATGNPKDFPMEGLRLEHWPVGE